MATNAFATRRFITAGVVGIAVLALPVAPVEAVPPPTFFVSTNHVGVVIQDNFTGTPYPSEIPVSGMSKGVATVRVTLHGLTHESPDDLDVVLASPSGWGALLMSDAGGSTPVSGLDLTFAAGPQAEPPDEGPLTSGIYRPGDHLPADVFPSPAPPQERIVIGLEMVFTFSDPNGSWRLFVVDDNANGVSGSITGWTLELRTISPPPTPVITSPPSGSGDNDGIVVLSGTGPESIRIMVFDGAALVGEASPRMNAWSLTLAGLAEGGHVFTAEGVDYYGNVTDRSAPVVVVVDRVQPTASLVINNAAPATRSRTVRLDVNATDAAPTSGLTSMRFSSDGTTFTAWEPYTSGRSWTLAPGSDGLRRVSVQVSDGAGNVSLAAVDTIRYDQTSPRIVVTRPQPGERGVPPSSLIKARAGEELLSTSVSRRTVKLTEVATDRLVPATIDYVPGKRLIVIDPVKPLDRRTAYEVRASTSIKDLAGNRLDQKRRARLQPMQWSFTTR